ncbi:MAG: hypothetical protein NVV66_16475 [Cellulomonas sp.]|uniref:hypothetical protein n=1 Tax=Cellulomonas sp. TaxID=40001 RepID=UPI0025847448|nr:hypothetical protein [Cellulomonas sp.]MCR6706211.1 hypothetical protein [Cellulomonas sp.]
MTSNALNLAARAAQELRAAERALTTAEHARRGAVLAARAEGHSWTTIGAAIGTTRSRAHMVAHPNGIQRTAA